MAPKQDDLAARMDPSRLRARGFNTGRAARSGGQEDTTVWHETAEQKQKRLAAEVLGISTTRNPASGEDNHERRSGLAKKIPSTDEREVCIVISSFHLLAEADPHGLFQQFVWRRRSYQMNVSHESGQVHGIRNLANVWTRGSLAGPPCSRNINNTRVKRRRTIRVSELSIVRRT